MRGNRFLASTVGFLSVCLLGLPAKASRLEGWEFDSAQNRLVFTTDGSVHPRAQLLSDPQRLVVDLPGIAFDHPLDSQPVGGLVREIRVGQYDAQTTRLVIELDPDYPIRSQQIRLWGVTEQQWVIQLPTLADDGKPVANDAISSTVATVRQGSAPQVVQLPQVPGSRDRYRPPATLPGEAAGRIKTVQLPIFGEPATASHRDRSVNKANDPAIAADFARQPASNTAPVAAEPAPTQIRDHTRDQGQAQVTQLGLASGSAQLQTIIATPNGFFIQTGGITPQVQVYRVRDQQQNRQVVIDLVNAVFADSLNSQSLPRQVYGVRNWDITRYATVPPSIRIVMSLESQSPEWQVTPTNQGGIWLTPVGGNSLSPAIPVVNQSPQLPPINPPVAAVNPLIAQTAPQGRRVVVLDAGHGGADPGAIGIGGLQEKGVVISITRQVAAVLEAQGIIVVMTRQGDQTVDLQPRVDIAENAKADIFVSIHANAISMDRPEVNGIETYYYSDSGERLANVLHSRVISQMGLGDRGVRQARFYVLRRTSMPATLIETGFVTGAIDAPYLRDPQWQARMGQAIAAGILDYLRQP